MPKFQLLNLSLIYTHFNIYLFKDKYFALIIILMNSDKIILFKFYKIY